MRTITALLLPPLLAITLPAFAECDSVWKELADSRERTYRECVAKGGACSAELQAFTDARAKAGDCWSAAAPATPVATPDTFGAAPTPTPAPPGPRPPKTNMFGLDGKLGYHAYTGPGWSSFGSERYKFEGLAIEAGGRLIVHTDRDIRLEIPFEAGFYGGQDDCLPDGNGNCITITLSNLYFDTGGRLTLFARPFYLYGQAGFGIYSSSIEVIDPVNGNFSNSRSTPSAHVSGGAGFDLDERLFVFAELKLVSADGRFPGATVDLGMGGTIFFLGGSLEF